MRLTRPIVIAIVVANLANAASTGSSSSATSAPRAGGRRLRLGHDHQPLASRGPALSPASARGRPAILPDPAGDLAGRPARPDAAPRPADRCPVSSRVRRFRAGGADDGLAGNPAMAGHQVAINLASLTFMVPLGVADAASVLVGQAVGRGDPVGARGAARFGAAVWGGVHGLHRDRVPDRCPGRSPDCTPRISRSIELAAALDPAGRRLPGVRRAPGRRRTGFSAGWERPGSPCWSICWATGCSGCRSATCSGSGWGWGRSGSGGGWCWDWPWWPPSC